MIVDFHVHTSISSDGVIPPERIPALAASRELDAVAVVDHGTIAGGVAARDARRPSDPLVIVGAEIKSSEGEIIGLFLSEEIPSRLTPEETVERIREQGGVVVVPHPFDRFRRSPLTHSALERIAPMIDAVEVLNARNLLRADDAKAGSWAVSRGVAGIAGSDGHTPGEVGRARTQLPSFHDAEGLRAALGSAKVSGGGSGVFVHVRTAVTKRLRARRGDQG